MAVVDSTTFDLRAMRERLIGQQGSAACVVACFSKIPHDLNQDGKCYRHASELGAGRLGLDAAGRGADCPAEYSAGWDRDGPSRAAGRPIPGRSGEYAN